MDEKLAEMQCSPPRGDEPPLTEGKIEEMLPRVPDWDVVEEDGMKKLRRAFDFSSFAEALDFTNRVGQIAEEERHHPVVTLMWGRATVTWYAHRINGLHKNDFIMAAKTDERYKSA
jgi:4a-hydroxytetrahydrobiopterin dehydratase